ncbi:hypothetical protein HHL16_10340 [Pseudoflavitalea sp. G-6-1-2]|uniref:hypothetical protein n=1 Tax=Pseudoflavitalea sp. G-6-1-2 TaxID=2728841 RepID=UPI001469B078|nr:hypothetical protein [Pseudoflavitalea sp. G-6-1-2]NML21273.1 hypothetical protein [Pseudoflavitalea sp. G-6-1-2]
MKIKMKPSKVPVVAIAIAVMMLHACKSEPERKKHTIEVFSPGSFFYLDPVKNKQVMQITSDEEDKQFASYLVGFFDSTYTKNVQQPKIDEDRSVYYQFHMGENWRAVINGDSVEPVFYHPVQNADTRLGSGVLVFPVTEGKVPDTLVYRSAADGWSNMIISLKQKRLIQ